MKSNPINLDKPLNFKIQIAKLHANFYKEARFPNLEIKNLSSKHQEPLKWELHRIKHESQINRKKDRSQQVKLLNRSKN